MTFLVLENSKRNSTTEAFLFWIYFYKNLRFKIELRNFGILFLFLPLFHFTFDHVISYFDINFEGKFTTSSDSEPAFPFTSLSGLKESLYDIVSVMLYFSLNHLHFLTFVILSSASLILSLKLFT